MFKRYGLAVLILAAFVVVVSAGCGKKEIIKPSDESIKAGKALGAMQEMERAYKARDMKGVLAAVSPDFKGGYAEFETRVRKDTEAFPRVELETAVERVEESGNDVRVVFHWYGKWWDSTGKEIDGRGNCVFVFMDTGTDMRLSAITGDPPFGVVR